MDYDFRKVVNEIKPLAKRLSRNTDARHLVTMWIRTLLNERDRSSRNHYARQLLLALQAGKLHAPFDSHPPMKLPQVDELDSLLNSTTIENMFGTCTSLFHNDSIPLTTPTQKEHRLFHSTPKGVNCNSASVAPAECFNSDGKRPNQKLKQGGCGRTLAFMMTPSSESCLDDDSGIAEFEYKHDFPSRQILTGNNFASSTSSGSSEADLSDVSTVLDTDLLEEDLLSHPFSAPNRSNLIIAAQHNKDMYDKSFRRKPAMKENSEKWHLQHMKHLERKCDSLGEKIDKMEKLKKDDNHRRLLESRGSTKKRHSLQSAYEQKLQSVVTDYECQQLDMKQAYGLELRQAMEGAQQRITQLKAEYARQKREFSQSLLEAEEKLQNAIQSMDLTSRAKRKLLKEKTSLIETVSSLEQQLRHVIENTHSLEEKIAILSEENSMFQSKADISVTVMKERMNEQRRDMSNEIDVLKQQVDSLQTQLQDEKVKYKSKLEDVENKHKMYISKETKSENQQKIIDLMSTLQSKEIKLLELQNLYDSVKREKESQLKATYENQTKTITEYQKRDESMVKEIERLEQKLAQESCNCKRKELEQRSKMNEEHSSHLLSIEEHHQSEIQSRNESIRELRMQLKEQSRKYKVELEHKQQIIIESKNTISSLYDQLQKQLRNHQDKLDEIRIQGDSDKKLMKRSQGEMVENMKSEFNQQCKLEVSAITEKHKIQMQQFEHDMNMKISMAKETIASLQSQNRIIKEDLERCLELHKTESDDLMRQKVLEIKSIQLKHEAESKSMLETIETSRNASEQLETRIATLQQTYEYELGRLQMEYDSRISFLSSPKLSDAGVVQTLQVQLQLMTQRAEALQKQLQQSQACTMLRKHMVMNPAGLRQSKK